MSIGVQSYPELYTLLMGWDLYDKLWNLLTETGIAYLPFIGIIFKNVGKSYLTQGTEQALRSMEIKMITTLLLIFFGAAPFIPLNAHTVSYSPVCGNSKGVTYYPGHTNTTYDKSFVVPEGDIRIPLWWYAVMSVSEGLTSAANSMLGCVPNLRKMVTTIDMAAISDPALKQEVQDFETMCYLSARVQFLKDGRTNNMANQDRIQEYTKKYGVEDTEWLGSYAFNAIYYPHLRSSRPVVGFPYQASEDINAGTDHLNPSTYGLPSCYHWWNDSRYGLKNRLYTVLPKSFQDEFREFLHSEQTQDGVIKKIIANTARGYAGYTNANDTIGNIGYSHLVSALGIWYHQLEEYPKLYAASQAAPIIQALLLLMIYVFLPFALVFSGYNPTAFIIGAALIFSLIFWQFIWHLVSWTDKALMQALYTNWFTKQGAGATLTDMIIGTLVIVAPLFWLMFINAMGVAVGNAINGIIPGLSRVGDNAAVSGANAVKSTARSINKNI